MTTAFAREPMAPNLSRRGFIGGIGALGALMALSGCTPSGPGGGAGGTGTLDVALWGDTNRANLYQSALDLFGSSDVSTNLEFADLGPYLERLATSAAARDLPDVMWMRDTHIGRYGTAGALLDLSPYIGDRISTDDIGDAAVADGTIDGSIVALPTHYVGQAVLFDAARVDEIGADFSAIATWSDLADLARAASDTSTSYFGLADPTTGSTHRHLEAWVRQAGQELFDDEGRLGFDASTLEAWFEYWKQLRDAGAVPTADVQIESESSGWTSDLLTTGRAAIRLASTNHLTIVQDLTESPISLASVPADPGSSDDWWFFPPILLSVAANTPSPEVAADLVDFFINDVDAGAITKLSQGAPSSAVVRDAILPDLSDQERQFVEQISREQTYPRRPFPIRPEGAEAINTALSRVGQEIAYNRQSVSQAVGGFMTDAEQILTAS